MGTIITRKRNDGSTGYTAQILLKKSGKIIHREAKTFDREQAAKAWLKRRETELNEPGAIDRAKVPEKSLASAIDRYIADSRKAIGNTAHFERRAHGPKRSVRIIRSDPESAIALVDNDAASPGKHLRRNVNDDMGPGRREGCADRPAKGHAEKGCRIYWKPRR
jgi:hypothetical protein